MFAMSNFPRRFAAAAAVAGAMFLAGCGAPDPAQLVQPTAPQRPPSVSADTTSCGSSGSLGYTLCTDRAQRAAERENASNQADFERATAQYEAAMKRYNAAKAEAAKSPWERFWDRLTLPVILGALFMVAPVLYARSEAASDRKKIANLIAEGRDPAGPAVQKINAGIEGFNAFLGVISAGGAVALGIGLWGISGAFLAGVPAGLIAWGLIKRGIHLDGVENGYKAAEADYQADLAAAIAEAAAETTTPHDDLGLGLDPVTPTPRAVPEPILTREEALLYGRTGGVELVPGSAAAALIDRTGKAGPEGAFWVQACEAARLGSAGESGTFIPSAALVLVTPLANGDAVLTAKPDSITVGEQQLSGVTQPFIRAASIRSALGSWERDHTSGEWSLTVSNRAPEKAKVQEEWV